MQYLQREIAAVAALFERGREVVQLHFGGGTPNFLDGEQLERVVASLRRHFHFSDAADRDISIELDPRTTGPAHVGALAAAGFTRASLGVQDFSPQVQRAINRVQGFEQTAALAAKCEFVVQDQAFHLGGSRRLSRHVDQFDVLAQQFVDQNGQLDALGLGQCTQAFLQWIVEVERQA
ncbi:MAG: radical SAM protein [Pseudoxanthomonas sp.]